MRQVLFSAFLVISGLLVLIGQVDAENVGETKSYTLDECRQLASEHNKGVEIAKEKVNAAKSIKKAAFTQYLPNISASGGYLWTSDPIQLISNEKSQAINNLGTTMQQSVGTAVGGAMGTLPPSIAGILSPIMSSIDIATPINAMGQGITNGLETDTRNIFVGGVSMVQPIFMGGKIVEMNKIAKAAEKFAEANMKKESSSVTYQTDEAYWRVVSLVNKVKLAKSYVKLLERLSSDVEKSIETGTSTKADGLSVRVKLNEAQMTLLQAEDGLSLSKMALCQIIGLPVSTDIHLSDEDIEPKVRLESGIDVNKQQGIDNRNEIQQLQSILDIAESNRRIQIGNFLPHIGLTAGYVVSNPNLLDGFEKKFRGFWQVGVGVHVPITHFGERLHKLNAARSMRNIARLNIENAREMVDLDITQSEHKLRESYKRETMSMNNREKADENLRYATISFDAGVVPASSLMEAQTAWLKAHSDAIDAMIQSKIAETSLKKAIGGLK